ncbi:MAG: hypothetical protein JXQ93_13565 [Flavobacteriaceae bacterium]
MKKIVLLFVIISLSSFTNTNFQKQKTIELLCSGKWYINYGIINGVKRNFQEDRRKNTWFLLHKDGTSEAMSTNGLHKGVWELNNETKNLKFIENSKYTQNKDEITVQKIISIDSNELALEMTNKRQKITLYFKKGFN